jgi:hypothetical protein
VPRVTHVKAAAKDHPAAGIKKGESYYWWKFRFGGKHMSKTPPRPSQLTQSDFLSTQLELEERIGDLKADTFEDLKGEVESIVEEIRRLGEEQADKIGNLPDSFQQGPTGELLQGRADGCEEWADALEGVDLDVDEPTEDDATEAMDEKKPTMTDIESDLEKDEDKDAKLDELVTAWENDRTEKLGELKADYEGKIEEAIAELQGCSYEGE